MKYKNITFTKTSVISIFLSVLVLGGVVFSRLLSTALKRKNLSQIQVQSQSDIEAIGGGFETDTDILGEGTQSLHDLPEIFPKDFPVYENAKLNDVWIEEGENLDAVSVIWESKDQPKPLFDFYKTRLEMAGWTSEIVLDSDDSHTLSFEKGKAEGFMGITKGEEETTVISVTMGIRKLKDDTEAGAPDKLE